MSHSKIRVLHCWNTIYSSFWQHLESVLNLKHSHLHASKPQILKVSRAHAAAKSHKHIWQTKGPFSTSAEENWWQRFSQWRFHFLKRIWTINKWQLPDKPSKNKRFQCLWWYALGLILSLCWFHCINQWRALVLEKKNMQLPVSSCKVAVIMWQCIRTWSLIHTGLCRFRRPNAWAPTLVGTKLLCPSPPDRLRKSAKRWVTQVAVLHPRFCVVALLTALHREEKQWYKAVTSKSQGHK